MAIHATVTSFSLALSKYGDDKIPEFARGRLTVIAMTGARYLTELTAVDTGRAKGNWQVSIGTPREGEIDREDDRPEGAPSAVLQNDVLTEMRSWDIGDWVWFHNGVPYIGPLNERDSMLERTKDLLDGWLRSE